VIEIISILCIRKKKEERRKIDLHVKRKERQFKIRREKQNQINMKKKIQIKIKTKPLVKKY